MAEQQNTGNAAANAAALEAVLRDMATRTKPDNFYAFAFGYLNGMVARIAEAEEEHERCEEIKLAQAMIAKGRELMSIEIHVERRADYRAILDATMRIEPDHVHCPSLAGGDEVARLQADLDEAQEALDYLWRASFGGTDPSSGMTMEQCRERYAAAIDKARLRSSYLRHS